MKINDIIKERRKKLGLSADKIAEQLHISRASYYRYETDEVYNLPIDIVKPLCEILHLSPAYLMGWEDEQGNALPEEGIPLVQELYDQLSEGDQEEIIEIMRMKLKKKKDTGQKEILSA